MTRLLPFVALATMFALSTPAFPQAADSAVTAPLQGKVTDNYGIAITTAFVYIHGDNKISQEIPINENGEFTLDLPPGIYSVFISSTGFAAFAKEIKISRNRPAPVVLKVKLHVDLEIKLDD